VGGQNTSFGKKQDWKTKENLERYSEAASGDTRSR